MSKFQIDLNGHVDRKMIEAALLTSQPFVIDIKNSYDASVDYNQSINLADVDPDDLEAFMRIIDNCTFPMEENALIWKIIFSGGDFKFEHSFVRDTLSTDGTLTVLPDGTPLMVRFEIPGFEVPSYRDITLWYNQDFNPADLDALAEIGISLVGNGFKFAVTNATDFKISFSKPEAAAEKYIIDYDFRNQIFAP